MFDKLIYNNWELHKDATQLEISYRFFVQLIEVLDVKLLLQYDNVGNEIKIDDKNLIHKWQEKRINKLFSDFNTISSISFIEDKWHNNDDIFISTFFRLSQILRSFKKINYKAQQLDTYYEPLLFKLATKFLSVENFEYWMINMTSGILNHKKQANTHIPFNVNWKIVLNDKAKNTVWFLENLTLAFNDITSWHNQTSANSDILNNILNHWIIYVLTDFYLKYIYDQNDKNKIAFQELYDVVLSLINKMVQDHTFAVIGFKSIAFFINQLLRFNIINKDDQIIKNFSGILEITTSNKNKMYLEEIMFEGKEAKEFKKLIKPTNPEQTKPLINELDNKDNKRF